MNQVTALIPFHNESETLFDVITVLNAIKEVKEIILVDDGSHNNLSEKIISEVDYSKKNIHLHFTGKNIGKSGAIRHGIKHASFDTVILIDADIKNPSVAEFTKAIEDFFIHKADMVILKRVNSLPTLKLIRANTLLSGERILKKQFLEAVLASGVQGYEIELALNQYMIVHKKTVFCRPNSAKNTYKFMKRGIIKGLQKDAKMYYQIINYVGASNFIKQWLFFPKKITKNL